MKYPSVFLKGKGAKANMLSMSFAGQGQVQDNGAKALHLADSTSSSIVSKSLAKNGGCAIFRGSVKVNPHLKEIKSKIRCDSLILDSNSRAESYPAIQSESNEVQIAHEATISKINEEQLFYLRSRGLTEDEATLLIVNGFMEPIVQTVPVEYAVEMTRMMAFF
jgi:Fe-S cluster assembly protein SufB